MVILSTLKFLKCLITFTSKRNIKFYIEVSLVTQGDSRSQDKEVLQHTLLLLHVHEILSDSLESQKDYWKELNWYCRTLNFSHFYVQCRGKG